MKRLYKVIAITVICSIILVGCWDQKVFEQVGLMLTIGIEVSEDGDLMITYAYPVIGGKEKDAVDIGTAKSTLVRGGREELRYKAPKNMEGGKIQQILISENLAKLGLHDITEIMQRDVTLPAITYIAVVEGSPNEMLVKGTELKNKPRISFYIFQLLENNVNLSNIPNTKVFDFDINYFAPGLDPVTPMIKLSEDSVEITGSALFSDDKMVGKLNRKQTIALLSVMGQIKNSEFIFSDPQFQSKNPVKYGIAILLHKPKRKITFDFDEEGTPVINISLKFKGVLDEYKWNETNESKEQKKIEGVITKDLNSILNETIKILQEKNSDPIGLGNLIRAKYYDYWQSINWKEVYPKAKIKVDAQIEIVKEGIIK